MVSPKDKSAAHECLCSREKPPTLSEIFPLESWPPNPPEWLSRQNRAQRAPAKIVGINGIQQPILPDGSDVKLIDKIKLKINPSRSIQIAAAKRLSPAELHRLYASTSVPKHRYLAPFLNEAVNCPEIAPHPEKWLADVSGIDLSKVVNDWLNTNRSTEYEQLYCIGLDPDNGKLTGVFTVKQGSGYSGGPRTAGSREYVAFWVDWGSGFKYEGTASVAVHDFGWLPPAGLEYSVSLSIDLHSRVQPRSEGRRTVKVRAVLSWNTPPLTTDLNAPVVWGNMMEGRILIPSSQDARESNRVPCFTSARAEEIDEGGADGQIVDAAIKAITGMAFGPDLGLTVVPNGAITNAGATDRSFAIHTGDIEDGGATFALYVWNRTNLNRGATSNLDHTPAGLWTEEKS
jgi:hypothetical protein